MSIYFQLFFANEIEIVNEFCLNFFIAARDLTNSVRSEHDISIVQTSNSQFLIMKLFFQFTYNRKES